MKNKNYKRKSQLIMCTIILVTIILSYISYAGIGTYNALSAKNINQGLDLKGGVSIVYEAQLENPTTEEMDSAVSLLRGRLDSKGFTEAEVAAQGNKRIRVDVPGVEDAQAAIDQLGQTAQLSFMSSEGEVLVTGDQVESARRATINGNFGPEIVVELEFTDEGKQAFAEATTNNIGKPLIIMLDDMIISAPNVNEPITDGKAIINGGFTAQDAKELADLIRSGSLPFDLTVIQRSEIGATLGADSLQRSVKAGMIGFSIVLVFMVVFYKVAGLGADIALIIFITTQLILLNGFNVTLTLPGMAGIILSIGMAVDANIIIFERIKEELNTGRSLKASVDSGFKRAFPAIVDGNITTLIAAFVLFWLGTGPIKGFAQTLTIGILVSMFTALVVTRLILKTFLGIGIENTKLYGSK